MSLDDQNTVSETVDNQQSLQVDEPNQLIYCGPSLPTGVLNRHTVYQGGLPKQLESYFDKCPTIKRLFVPIESFLSTMQSIQKAGSAESVWFKQVLDYIQGGAK